MKKVSLHINTLNKEEGAVRLRKALNDLSGVVAAHVSISDQVAYAYTGDRLSKDTLTNVVHNAGYEAGIVNEEYLQGLK